MKLRDSLATDIKPGYAFMLNREKQAFWVQDFVVKAHDQDPQDPDEWVLLGSQRRCIRCRVGRVGSASARGASEVHHQKGSTGVELAIAPQISCNRTNCN